MKVYAWLLALATGAGLFFSSGCYYDNFQELHPEFLLNNGNCDTTVAISFTADISPILGGSCGANNSCHNASSTSGVYLSQYANVRTLALNGILWSSITWDGNASNMPQGSSSKISDCHQAKIRKWIDEGAPE